MASTCQHDTVTLGRIVGHRVSTDGFFRILTFQAEQTEFFPCGQILRTDKVFIDILLLVVILLVAKQYLTPSGKVKITINGEKELEVEQGSTLLNTLSVNGIYLSA